MANINGWGRGTWGQLTWGEPIPVSPVTNNVLSISGVAGTAAVGSLTTTAHANIYPTGVEGTGNITSVIVWGLIIPGQTANYSTISTGQTTDWEEVA